MSINQAIARDFGLRLSRAAGSVDAKANMLAARGAADEAAVLQKWVGRVGGNGKAPGLAADVLSGAKTPAQAREVLQIASDSLEFKHAMRLANRSAAEAPEVAVVVVVPQQQAAHVRPAPAPVHVEPAPKPVDLGRVKGLLSSIEGMKAGAPQLDALRGAVKSAQGMDERLEVARAALRIDRQYGQAWNQTWNDAIRMEAKNALVPGLKGASSEHFHQALHVVGTMPAGAAQLDAIRGANAAVHRPADRLALARTALAADKQYGQAWSQNWNDAIRMEAKNAIVPGMKQASEEHFQASLHAISQMPAGAAQLDALRGANEAVFRFSDRLALARTALAADKQYGQSWNQTWNDAIRMEAKKAITPGLKEASREHFAEGLATLGQMPAGAAQLDGLREAVKDARHFGEHLHTSEAALKMDRQYGQAWSQTWNDALRDESAKSLRRGLDAAQNVGELQAVADTAGRLEREYGSSWSPSRRQQFQTITSQALQKMATMVM